jgi:hypothetical protein
MKKQAITATPTKQPDLAIFQKLVIDSQMSRVKDPKKLSIVQFLDEWKTLERMAS